jgi:hypothetical protein
VVARYRRMVQRLYFLGDAAFANPEMYEFLEAEGAGYTIRLPTNSVLQVKIDYLPKRPIGRPQHEVRRYILGNFTRTLAMPKAVEAWSLTSQREKLIKIGAKVVSHGRYVTYQMAEVAVSRQMFTEVLLLIARLRAPPTLA